MTCYECAYFCQHYIKMAKNFRSVACGHCMYPRIKTRKPETPSCSHFKPKE